MFICPFQLLEVINIASFMDSSFKLEAGSVELSKFFSLPDLFFQTTFFFKSDSDLLLPSLRIFIITLDPPR